MASSIAHVPLASARFPDGIRLALIGGTPLRKEHNPPETRNTQRETGCTRSPALSSPLAYSTFELGPCRLRHDLSGLVPVWASAGVRL